MDSLDTRRTNLKPAKPGEKRNPTGRNRWDKQKELLREVGHQVLTELVKRSVNGEVQERTRWEWVIRAMCEKAMRGSVPAAAWVRDTVLGRPGISLSVQNTSQIVLQLGSVADIVRAAVNAVDVKSENVKSDVEIVEVRDADASGASAQDGRS